MQIETVLMRSSCHPASRQSEQLPLADLVEEYLLGLSRSDHSERSWPTPSFAMSSSSSNHRRDQDDHGRETYLLDIVDFALDIVDAQPDLAVQVQRGESKKQ